MVSADRAKPVTRCAIGTGALPRQRQLPVHPQGKQHLDRGHALITQFQDGTIGGPWHSSYIDTTVKGSIVRSILAGISELDPPYQGPGEWARFEAFREAIDEDANYTVKAIEC